MSAEQEECYVGQPILVLIKSKEMEDVVRKYEI